MTVYEKMKELDKNELIIFLEMLADDVEHVYCCFICEHDYLECGLTDLDNNLMEVKNE